MRTALPVLVGALLLLLPSFAEAQLRLRDLVITAGGSVERYRGNLPAVALPVVDSTERADAASGEFGLRGEVGLWQDDRGSLELRIDAGMRQFSTRGFRIREYAPTEWVMRGEVAGARMLDSGIRVFGSLTASAREVRDRTPIPLFIEPSSRGGAGTAGLLWQGSLPVQLGVEARFERTDFQSIRSLPQLDLLDRTLGAVEGSVAWRSEIQAVRGWVRVGRSEYPEQGTFDPEDPFRRDRSLHAGALWTFDGRIYGELGLEATANRSNSRRPEYDAASLRGLVSGTLPAGIGVQLFASVTGKRYLTPSAFVRLVPGEEADNASLLFLQLGRPLAPNLDGAVRMGWSRAETELGDSYFDRSGVTLFLNFRPFLR